MGTCCGMTNMKQQNVVNKFEICHGEDPQETQIKDKKSDQISKNSTKKGITDDAEDHRGMIDDFEEINLEMGQEYD